MPHVSKKNLNPETKKELEKYISNLLFESGYKTRREVFEEILTHTEKLMISKRIIMLLMIKKEYSSYEISKKLKVSTSTVERYRRYLNSGKFRETNFWLKENLGNRFLNFATELILLPITVRKRNRLRK